jgi:hypothetical protein
MNTKPPHSVAVNARAIWSRSSAANESSCALYLDTSAPFFEIIQIEKERDRPRHHSSPISEGSSPLRYRVYDHAVDADAA